MAFYNIRDLTPGVVNGLIIGTVRRKSPISEWNTMMGTGKRFYFDIEDNTASIRCHVFDRVDEFHQLIQPGQIYLIEDIYVKAIRFRRSLGNNENEVTIKTTSTITNITSDFSDALVKEEITNK